MEAIWEIHFCLEWILYILGSFSRKTSLKLISYRSWNLKKFNLLEGFISSLEGVFSFTLAAKFNFPVIFACFSYTFVMSRIVCPEHSYMNPQDLRMQLLLKIGPLKRQWREKGWSGWALGIMSLEEETRTWVTEGGLCDHTVRRWPSAR